MLHIHPKALRSYRCYMLLHIVGSLERSFHESMGVANRGLGQEQEVFNIFNLNILQLQLFVRMACHNWRDLTDFEGVGFLWNRARIVDWHEWSRDHPCLNMGMGRRPKGQFDREKHMKHVMMINQSTIIFCSTPFSDKTIVIRNTLCSITWYCSGSRVQSHVLNCRWVDGRIHTPGHSRSPRFVHNPFQQRRVEKDWLSGLGTRVFVLLFELSSSYLTPLAESGFSHGEDCPAWNVFQALPYAINNRLRTGVQGG